MAAKGSDSAMHHCVVLETEWTKTKTIAFPTKVLGLGDAKILQSVSEIAYLQGLHRKNMAEVNLGNLGGSGRTGLLHA